MSSRYCVRILWSVFVVAVVGRSALAADDGCSSTKDKPVTDLPLVFCEDFESGAEAWEPADPQAWKLETLDGNTVFAQFAQSKVKNPVRSPFNRCIRKGDSVGSFVLDVKFQSTKKDYPHRDLCLFFGFQDPSHLYYVHFGKRTDDHANQIFIVNEQPRTKISTKTTPGTDWDDEWHHARIKRNVQSGSIEVFFDDMQTPVMTATDKTFQWGRVGIGSFDDTGRFDNVMLFGQKAGK